MNIQYSCIFRSKNDCIIWFEFHMILCSQNGSGLVHSNFDNVIKTTFLQVKRCSLYYCLYQDALYISLAISTNYIQSPHLYEMLFVRSHDCLAPCLCTLSSFSTWIQFYHIVGSSTPFIVQTMIMLKNFLISGYLVTWSNPPIGCQPIFS